MTNLNPALIICLDGTGDQFDDDNSNIVKLFACVKENITYLISPLSRLERFFAEILIGKWFIIRYALDKILSVYMRLS